MKSFVFVVDDDIPINLNVSTYLYLSLTKINLLMDINFCREAVLSLTYIFW